MDDLKETQPNNGVPIKQSSLCITRSIVHTSSDVATTSGLLLSKNRTSPGKQPRSY